MNAINVKGGEGLIYAVISDIHGNAPALRAVLRDAKAAGAEQFLLTGDYITDLPYTREIYETLRDLKHAALVSGNRERYMDTLDPALRNREQFASLFLTREALGEDGRSWVRALPCTARLFTPDGKKTIFLEHICEEFYGGGLHQVKTRLRPSMLSKAFPNGATRQETKEFAKLVLEQEADLPALKKRVGADVVLHGHNHMQYAVTVDRVLYVNPGACGQPLDHDTRAPYTLLRYEDGVFTAEERRVPYDIEGTVRECKASQFYQEAETWCELIFHNMKNGREFGSAFWKALEEEEAAARPVTDEQYNQAFRRAFLRVKEKAGA